MKGYVSDWITCIDYKAAEYFRSFGKPTPVIYCTVQYIVKVLSTAYSERQSFGMVRFYQNDSWKNIFESKINRNMVIIIIRKKYSPLLFLPSISINRINTSSNLDVRWLPQKRSPSAASHHFGSQ